MQFLGGDGRIGHTYKLPAQSGFATDRGP
jgi:hypothetical protein